MYKRRLTVRGVIIDKNGKVFAQQLKKTISKGGDWWCTPGGGVDDGEDIVSALQREMIEETGVKPEIGRLLFVQQFVARESKSDPEHIELFFHITNTQNYQNIDLSKTTHGELEIANFGFINPKKVNILPTDLQAIDIDTHIAKNLPVRFFSHL